MPPLPRPDPVAAATPEARSQALALLGAARHAALAVIDPGGLPGISRIAFGLGPAGEMVTLISSLSAHHGALSAHPLCAVMVGEPGTRGDPLTHPRLMVLATARFVSPDDPARAALRARWLADHPKTGLYVDFADFGFVRFDPVAALLNGGFGRAFRLETQDLVG